MQHKFITTCAILESSGNIRGVLSQCNTRLRLLHLLYDIEIMQRKTIRHSFSMFYTLIKKWVFDQSECAQGPIYIITDNKPINFFKVKRFLNVKSTSVIGPDTLQFLHVLVNISTYLQQEQCNPSVLGSFCAEQCYLCNFLYSAPKDYESCHPCSLNILLYPRRTCTRFLVFSHLPFWRLLTPRRADHRKTYQELIVLIHF